MYAPTHFLASIPGNVSEASNIKKIDRKKIKRNFLVGKNVIDLFLRFKIF